MTRLLPPLRPLPLLLALLAAPPPALAGEVALIAIRDQTVVRSRPEPSRTRLTIDLYPPRGARETRTVVIRDAAMQKSLFRDPFIHPAHADVAYLVAEEKAGFRCQRFSWSLGEDLGNSFVIPLPADRTFVSRPIRLLPDRFALLAPDCLHTFDLGSGTARAATLTARPLTLDPLRNRLYFAGAKLLRFWAVDACNLPEDLARTTQVAFAMPEPWAPVRGAVDGSGQRVAWVAPVESRREDAERFVLAVADQNQKLLVRRTFAGRAYDLAWHGRETVVVTTVSRERFTFHVVGTVHGDVRSRRLPPRFLAPPEIVAAAPLKIRG